MASTRQKVEMLGFNCSEFEKELWNYEEMLMAYSDKLYPNLEKPYVNNVYNFGGLWEYIYPNLKRFKEQTKRGIPITLFGIDIIRLDNILSSLTNTY